MAVVVAVAAVAAAFPNPNDDDYELGIVILEMLQSFVIVFYRYMELLTHINSRCWSLLTLRRFGDKKRQFLIMNYNLSGNVKVFIPC